MATKKDIAPVDVGDYKLMRMDPEAVRELIAENLGGGFSLFDLPVITVPTGGTTFWSIPSADGPVPVKEFEGIIAYQRPIRTYFARGLDEPGAEKGPPDCVSFDMIHGIGEPGGECATCPMNQWGTAKGGTRKGKACSERRALILLRPDSLLPVRLQVPPTSLGNLSQYLMNLTDQGALYNTVVTRFGLDSIEKGGNSVATIEAHKVAGLTAEQVAAVKPMKEQFRSLFDASR